MASAPVAGLRRRQLRLRLLAFFVALALPAALLFWLGYSRLNWEVYHQYRGQAEVLTESIDRELEAGVEALERLGFEDFAFLTREGSGASAVVRRSPISGWPVERSLPGLLGYFQVNADGEFTTPLLPPADVPSGALGIGSDELSARRNRTDEIRRILSDNQLVPRRGEAGYGGVLDRVAGIVSPSSPRVGAAAGRDADDALYADGEVAPGAREEVVAETANAAAPAQRRQVPEQATAVAAEPAAAYDQDVFDKLAAKAGSYSAPSRAAPATAAEDGSDDRADGDGERKLSELQLDERLLRKSEQAESARRSRLAEAQSTAPESAAPPIAADAERDAAPAPIEAFRREASAYELGVLGRGHFVLFRSVYRDGERFVQGALLSRERFFDQAFAAPFRRAGVAEVASLLVVFGDAVLDRIGGAAAAPPSDHGAARDTLLHRSRLSAPLGDLSLVYTVDRLPAGAGSRVLVWTGVAFAIVLAAGMSLLYRLGAGQIALARQQQDFVAAVSHELRTPLTSIRMYAEMLREGWVGEERRATYYRYIHDESERLTRLIANVLELARISRNEANHELRALTVGELLSDGEARIRSQVVHAGFELRMRIDPGVAEETVSADPDAIAQILINLVDNAIKFSAGAETRAVEVGARRGAADTVELYVRDFGPGIPPDQMKRIFQLFYRPASELTRETVGTGIGLAIVRELAGAMGGSVDGVNREPGAEFIVALPRAAGGGATAA